MSGTRFGLILGSLADHQWALLPEMLGDVDRAGADAVWFTDHLFAGHASGDPLVLAGVASTATRRCAIGTGVLQLALRRPAAVAKSVATLQRLSGGRFRLGVGVGVHRDEFERAGVDFAGRGAATDTALATMQEARRSSGSWFDMQPNDAAPVWFGGHAPATLRRVTRHGVGWMPLFIGPERFRELGCELDRLLRDAGREPSEVARHMVLVVAPVDGSWTGADVADRVATLFPGGLDVVGNRLVVGPLDDCVAKIDAYRRAGAEGLDLMMVHPDPVGSFLTIRDALLCGT